MPEPWVVGTSEITERLGRSRQQVQQLAEHRDFPIPFAELRMGRIWWRRDVELWIAGRQGAPSEQTDCRQLAARVADWLGGQGQVFIEDDEIEALSGLLRNLLSTSGSRPSVGLREGSG